MKYNLTKPCSECPFLKSMTHGFTIARLKEFSSGAFPCHKTATLDESDDLSGDFIANENSEQCAGALMFLEKRNTSNNIMRIMERLKIYDPNKLDMTAKVR